MPFVYRGKLANIDRSSKRFDNEINDLAIKSLNEILLLNEKKEFPSLAYIQILPHKIEDHRIEVADHRNFLALHAIANGLTWYEIEHWLDELCYKISIDGAFQFNRERSLSLYFDFRRRLYKIPSGAYSTSISCRRSYVEGIIK